MVKKQLFKLKKIAGNLSVRSSFCCLLAIAISLLAVRFSHYVPDKFADLAGGDAVDGILTFLASSMLIVATFSLSSMVTAYGMATQQSTPRATVLIKDDTITHSAISVFLGAFIYSIVSVIALSTGYYGEKGRVILLIFTVLVLSGVVWIIIRWVGVLKNMISVSESIGRVEKITSSALEERITRPLFGCNVLNGFPKDLIGITPREIGFLQNIDVARLGSLSEAEGIEIYIARDVGAYVHTKSIIAYLRAPTTSSELEHKVRSTFSIGRERTFASDPLYGLSVLSGIGIKAMSPSLNDPGTAVDVVGSLVRVLLQRLIKLDEHPPWEVEFKHVYFPELQVRSLFDEAFLGLIEQSTGSLQVLEAIRSGLLILKDAGSTDYATAADTHLETLRLRAREKMTLQSDLQRLL